MKNNLSLYMDMINKEEKSAVDALYELTEKEIKYIAMCVNKLA